MILVTVAVVATLVVAAVLVLVTVVVLGAIGRVDSEKYCAVLSRM